ncbi:hypothetical protein [Microbacterium sp. NIBRBAC000506063]|uniref:hypothetical protein n=1 Tax=Microbacterium sp. NIBRBAC000506063 TaxID=2734618 RepID=UPI001BB77EEB|nr:hypothetical protein [Microbacterium sp. NIBRBAC000506063]QTV79193.1 hypothetical protein KAE78_08975 [Microbacterium sp. NIBRBAC000506063]
MSTLIDPMADDWSVPGTWSAVAALAVTGAGLLGFGVVARRRAGIRPLLGVVRVCAAIYLSAAALVLVSGGVLPGWRASCWPSG